MAGHKIDYGKRFHYQSDSPTDAKESHAIGSKDTVYRYLCPNRKIGSIIGKGGEIVKQLRLETRSKIRISDYMPGCEERVVIIYSSSEETNSYGDNGDLVSPALDALFKVHDRIVSEEAVGDEFDEIQQVVVRLLVPSDQIGCVIGKGGQVVQNIRNETRAQVCILSSDYLPNCALNFDELLQISGDTKVVRKALYQVASLIHDNPSRSQHLVLPSSNLHRASGGYMGPNPGGSMGAGSLMGPYANYTNDSGDRSMEFSLRLACSTENIGAVIGKGGVIIKQIRQESGASVTVYSSSVEGDDCLITISAKELFEDTSPTIEAAMCLQPRCSDKFEKDSGISVITTRLLVPSARIGCLIGKGGAIISEMRNSTRANIRILNVESENFSKVASEDEEMVQITGEYNVASNALLEVTKRLRANVFEMDLPVASRHKNRDGSFRGSGSQISEKEACIPLKQQFVSW